MSRETYGESLRLLYLVTNKNMSMKKSILSFASILLLFSCGNNSSQNSSFQNSENSSFVVVDTMAEENIAENISAESASSSNLPYGYSKRRYTEYQPQNDIERRLFADLKEMTDATNKLDYKNTKRDSKSSKKGSKRSGFREKMIKISVFVAHLRNNPYLCTRRYEKGRRYEVV